MEDLFCSLIFSTFVRTLGSHEWSLYDFYSSCNSFFSRLICDVYTSSDGLTSNTVNILRVAFFRAPQKKRKIRAMRKCTQDISNLPKFLILCVVTSDLLY